MRAAYICADPGVPAFGRKGASVHVQSVLRALLRKGVDVELFAARVDGDPPHGCECVRVHTLPRLPKGALAAREQAALASNEDVHAALAGAGPFDFVYERYSLWAFAGMEYARGYKLPGLLEVNAPLIEEQAAHRGLVDRDAAAGVAQRAFSAATALLAVSATVADYLKRYPEARGRIHVVPNAVDPERFPPAIQPAIARDPDTFRIGFVGTLKPWHGLDTLVDAFGSLYADDKTLRLLIVGDGPERERLAHSVRQRQLDDVVDWTGAVDPDHIPALLAAMDVAVAPYPALEHFYFSPLKVYEYMAAGRCVVASRIGQIAEMLTDGVDSVLYPPGDVEALASALKRLRDEPELCERIGKAARATVVLGHTWDVVADRILELAAGSSSPETQKA